MSSKLKLTLGFLVLIAGFLVIRIGFIFGNHLKNSDSTANILTSLPTGSKQGNTLTRDSDHDGLPDREEIVYGTDPFKSDTDGDGYLDGIEVATGHNPLDASDNDKTRPGNFSPLKPNLTAKTVNLTIASLIGDDGSLNPNNLSSTDVNVVVNTLNTQAGVLFFIEPVKDSDLQISDDNSPEAVAGYIAIVSPIFKNYIFNPKILAGIADSNNGIQTAIDGYQRADQALRLMTVPSSWKTVHKNLINITDELLQSSQYLTRDEINNDPIKSLYALKQLRNALSNIPNLTTQIVNLSKSQGVQIQSLFSL